jgi:hypothetical protein
VLRLNFTDLDVSVAYIPKRMLPRLEVPFRVLNVFLSASVRNVTNKAPGLLRFLALNEERHQSQIHHILRSSQFPAKSPPTTRAGGEG